jgi:putative transcriptional regulator
VHPPEDLLLAVVAGEADLPHRLLVEGHLETCAACRNAAAELSAPGGALLSSLHAEQLPGRLWERLRTAVADLPPASADDDPLFAGLPLPASLRRELPRLPAIPWRRLPVRGARLAMLLRDPFTGSALILGHMPARSAFPLHVHAGPEDVLVLAGGYADQFGTFEAGAYGSYAPGTEHRPFTEPDEECWTLLRLEKPNRFRGWRGWMQRLGS